MHPDFDNQRDHAGMPLSGLRHLAVNQLNARVYDGSYQLTHVDQCFCGDGNFKQLSRFDRFGLPFGTKICIRCGLITLDPMLSERDWESFYNDIYWPLISGSIAPTYQTSQEDFGDFTAFIGPHLSHEVKTVMEVGCGAGVRLKLIESLLTGRSVRLIGCDYADAALELARSRGIEVMRGDMQVLKAAGKTDVLILSHVFEHLPDVNRALTDISDLTHPNSTIYIEVPGVVDLENKKEYGFDYQDYCVLAHVHNFSLTTLANVFRCGGFQLVQGTEYVRAVFRQSASDPQSVSTAPYDQIIAALSRARVKSHRHHRSFVRRLRRALSAAKEAFSLSWT